MSTNQASASTIPTITTLRWVPEFARGLVRDMRVRWALEEAGLPYLVETVDFDEKELPAYRSMQPFGQVPAYRDGEMSLFESGAIVHRIAASSAALMPPDEAGRNHTLTWMFAALNTLEPSVMALVEIDVFNAEAAWAIERRPEVVEKVQRKLRDIDSVLKDRDYLVGDFTAADILMATVLNMLRHTELVAGHPHLHDYHQRCVNRPAALKAKNAQIAHFASSDL